jgi:hypothetical protein
VAFDVVLLEGTGNTVAPRRCRGVVVVDFIKNCAKLLPVGAGFDEG